MKESGPVSPTTSLSRKMTHNKGLLICTYIYPMRCSKIGQLQTSSHQLEIEVGADACTPLEEFSNCVIREWKLKNTKFATTLFFMRQERDTIDSLNKALAHYAM